MLGRIRSMSMYLSFLVLASVSLSSAISAGAAEAGQNTSESGMTYLYVSMAPEQRIQIYRMEAATGVLTVVDAISVEGAPGSLAVDPQKNFLFASLRTTSSLGSYRIDRSTGKLTHVSTVALPMGENAAFVKTDQTGKWLLS